MRPIDKDKLLDNFYSTRNKDHTWDYAHSLIINAPTIEQESQWIPCSSRLPDDGTEVFVYLFNNPKSPYIAWIEDNRWYTEEFEVDKEHEPLAWMPLPEAWRGDAE